MSSESPARVRVPVKTGVGVTSNLLGACIIAFPCCVLVVGGVVALFTGHAVIGIIAGLVGGVLMIGAKNFFADFFADAAVDATIDDEGFSLDGPGAPREHVPWGAVRVGRLVIHDSDDPDRFDVSIPCEGRASIRIATTLDETETLRNFLNILRAREDLSPFANREELWKLRYEDDDDRKRATAKAPKRKRGATDRPARSEIVRCASCGAALVPAESERVACASCGAENPMPDDVRKRLAAVRASRDAARAHDRAVARFEDQPHASTIRAASSAVGFFVLVAWVGAVFWASALQIRGHLDWATAGCLLGFAFGASFALYTVLRAVVASRATTMLTCLEIAASAPTATRREPGCRCCGAPLRVAEGDSLATCGYCGAVNVVSVLVPRDRASMNDDLRSVDEALEGRRFDVQLFVAVALVLGAPAAISAALCLAHVL